MSQITYTIQYYYGSYSGQRKITLDEDDIRSPIDVMWSRMKRAGDLTLGMAYMSAKIIDKKEYDDNEE